MPRALITAVPFGEVDRSSLNLLDAAGVGQATLVGHSAGPVRPPLSGLAAAEVDQLGALISRLGPQ